MKIVYDPNFPPSLVKIIRPFIEKYKFLHPSWCQKLTLIYNSESNSTQDGLSHCIVNSTSFMYREAALTFYPAFFVEEDAMEQMIIHDLLHTFYGQLLDFVNDLIDAATKDENSDVLRDFLVSRATELNESGTQDLSHVLLNKFKK